MAEPGEVKINRYEHGGARIYIKRPDGFLDLVADIYDDENAERRERIITALVDGGLIVPRKREP